MYQNEGPAALIARVPISVRGSAASRDRPRPASSAGSEKGNHPRDWKIAAMLPPDFQL